MKKSIKIIISLATVAIFALNSCKSNRTATTVTPAPAVEQADVFQSVAASYGEWSDVKMPVKIELMQPKKFSISGTLTMTDGSAVGIRLRMFGMEVGNLYVGADSVIAVVKPMGVYYAESTERFTAASGFGLSDIQALLLGRAFVPGNGQITQAEAPDFTTDRLEDGDYLLMPKTQPESVAYFYTATAGDKLAVNGLAMEVSGHKPAFCNFSDASDTPAGTVAGEIRLRATVRDHNIECTLTTNPGKAEWNRSIAIDRPTIPRNARRLSTAQLLNMLKSL